MKYTRATHHKQHGFTLIELLVVMGLLSALLVVVTDVAVAAVEVQNEASASATTDEEGRFVLARMSYDIRRATSVAAPTLGATDASLVLVIDGQNYTYSVQNGVLRLVVGASEQSLTSAQMTVSDFSVTRIGNNNGAAMVQLRFVVTSDAQNEGEPETQSFETVVGRRL